MELPFHRRGSWKSVFALTTDGGVQRGVLSVRECSDVGLLYIRLSTALHPTAPGACAASSWPPAKRFCLPAQQVRTPTLGSVPEESWIAEEDLQWGVPGDLLKACSWRLELLRNSYTQPFRCGIINDPSSQLLPGCLQA